MILPTIVTMFTVILSVAACILLLIIKKQWESYPDYNNQQVRSQYLIGICNYLRSSCSKEQIHFLHHLYHDSSLPSSKYGGVNNLISPKYSVQIIQKLLLPNLISAFSSFEDEFTVKIFVFSIMKKMRIRINFKMSNCQILFWQL